MEKVNSVQVQDASNSGGVEVDNIQIGNEDITHDHEPLREGMNQQTRMNPLSRNPMEVDLIIEKIFGFCSSEILAYCRLVCKQWKDVSLKEWRKKAVLCTSKTLEGGDSLMEYLQLQLQKNDDPLQLQNHPFKTLRIGSDFEEYLKEETNPLTNLASHIILQDIQGKRKNLERFLPKFHSLQVLELKSCEWIATTWDGKSPFSVSLKCLKIYRNDESRTSNFDRLDYIKRFPNVESLYLKWVCRKDLSLQEVTNRLKDFTLYLNRCRKDENRTLLNLKELELVIIPHFPLIIRGYNDLGLKNMNLLSSLDECKFPLERLVLDFTWDCAREMNRVLYSLLNLLASCRKSLQHLRATFDFFTEHVCDECREDRPIRLTPIRGMNIRMETLRKLELANGIWAMFLLAHVELPNMEKLIIEYRESAGKVNRIQYQMRHLDLVGKVFPKLETFELLDYHEIPGPELMTTFVNVNMMPNLIHLSVPLDKQAFQIVCENFRELRTLNILPVECQYAALDDKSLTGVAKDQDEGEPRPPNITDLARLTDLTIPSHSTFTDHAAIHGFLQLPRLHFLKANFDWISDGIKAKLTEHVTGSVQI